MTPPVMVRYSCSPDKRTIGTTTNKHSSKNENLYSCFVGCFWNIRNKKIREILHYNTSSDTLKWKQGAGMSIFLYIFGLTSHKVVIVLPFYWLFFDIYLHIKCVVSHSHHAERSWVKWSTGDIWTHLSHAQILPAQTDLKRLNLEENVLILYLLSLSRSGVALLRLFIALTLVFSCFILP